MGHFWGGGFAMVRVVLVALTLCIVVAACGESGPTPGAGANAYASYPPIDLPEGDPWVVIDTSLGRMKFRLLPDEAELAVNSFLFLVNEGYFDGQVFHRVMPGFMAQTGDPTGTGTGGPGYKFAIEPPQRPYVRGTLAMANSGVPDSNGSQFFIVLDDLTALGKLDADYTIFGEVLVLETGEQHRPTLATIEKFNAVSVAAGPGGDVPRKYSRDLSVNGGRPGTGDREGGAHQLHSGPRREGGGSFRR